MYLYALVETLDDFKEDLEWLARTDDLESKELVSTAYYEDEYYRENLFGHLYNNTYSMCDIDLF